MRHSLSKILSLGQHMSDLINWRICYHISWVFPHFIERFIEMIEPQFHTFTVSKICISLRWGLLQKNCLVLTCLSWKRVRALLRGSTVPQGAYIEEQRVDSVKREKVRSGPQVCLGGALIIGQINLFAFGFVNRQIQKTQQGNLTWGRPDYRQTKSCPGLECLSSSAK